MSNIILDQRTMYGPLPTHDNDGKPTGYPAQVNTAADAQAYWQAYADNRARNGLPPFPLAPGRTATTKSSKSIAAYIDGGRWVAQCPGGPTGQCRGGIATWPDYTSGCCLDCGTVYTISFPAQHLIAEATEALGARPPDNRHWHPAKGETPEQLRQENIENGYHPTKPIQQQEQPAMRARQRLIDTAIKAGTVDAKTLLRDLGVIDGDGNVQVEF